MTDRELLELAAKAAGIHQTGWIDDDPTIAPSLVAVDENDCTFFWNPLEDDGDTFRLAVKLRIDVAHARDFVVSGFDTAGSMWRENGDDCAATRRAIVRAAAEVGRRMP